jgi:hypothetical protein
MTASVNVAFRKISLHLAPMDGIQQSRVVFLGLVRVRLSPFGQRFVQHRSYLTASSSPFKTCARGISARTAGNIGIATASAKAINAPLSTGNGCNFSTFW